MSVSNSNKVMNTDTLDAGCKSICKIAAASILTAVLLMVLDIIATVLSKEAIDLGTFTAADWFRVFNGNWFSGLRNLGLLNVLEMTLAVPMFFAVYKTHLNLEKTYAALAMILSLAGMAIYISCNAAVPMFVLSSKYAAAATDVQRSLLAAAGEAVLARGEDFTPGAFIGFFLGEIANIIIVFVMLRGRIFSKATAYMGIIGIAALTAYTVWVTFIPVLREAAMILAMIGGLLSMVWSLLVALRLFWLGRPVGMSGMEIKGGKYDARNQSY